MTDPLDALREPLRPAHPDPTFTARLRARLERAVLAPWEASMPVDTSTTAPSLDARSPTLIPYLTVVDARDAAAFYVAAFGAVPRGEPIEMPDGRIGHAELVLGDSVLMMADEYPELGLLAPVNRGGATQTLHLDVTDPDAVVARAVDLGAVLERPVADAGYGRAGVVRDRSGHRWMVTRPAPAARAGDAVFVSLWVPDGAAATRFFATVLGAAPALHGGHRVPTLMLCYTVADLDAAIGRVRAAGGTATEPQARPYGLVSDAVDDQGLPFALHQGEGPPEASVLEVELRLPDTTKARAFYGTVLGWRFDPGAEPGTWRAVHPTPAVRLTPAQADPPLAVPTFPVDDLAAAAAAVERAGGRSEPAGGAGFTAADCIDDQGTRFALRQR